MLAWHALAGLAEAALTVAIVVALGRLARRDSFGLELSAKSAGLVVVASLAVAVLSLPAIGLASGAPDSYQAALAAAEQSGLAVGQIESPSKLSTAAAVVQNCQDNLAAALPQSEGPLVAFSTMLAGAFAWSVAWAGSRASANKSLTGCT